MYNLAFFNLANKLICLWGTYKDYQVAYNKGQQLCQGKSISFRILTDEQYNNLKNTQS